MKEKHFKESGINGIRDRIKLPFTEFSEDSTAKKIETILKSVENSSKPKKEMSQIYFVKAFLTYSGKEGERISTSLNEDETVKQISDYIIGGKSLTDRKSIRKKRKSFNTEWRLKNHVTPLTVDPALLNGKKEKAKSSTLKILEHHKQILHHPTLTFTLPRNCSLRYGYVQRYVAYVIFQRFRQIQHPAL